MKTLEAAISAVVEGDIDGFPTVYAATQSDRLAAAAKLPPLLVSRSALIRVLKAWRNGRYTADEVQQWASFVRRGFVSGATTCGMRDIDIEYDATDEKLIVEIIGRFDEIGDIIDGVIDDDEQVEMLRTLEV